MMEVFGGVLWVLGMAFVVVLSIVAVVLGALALLAWWPLRLRIDRGRRRTTSDCGVAPLFFLQFGKARVHEPTGDGGGLRFGLRDGCASVAHNAGSSSAPSCVLLHGLSSCPAQFSAFAGMLAGRGWNVRVPRMPWHGEAEDLSRLPLKLRIEELVQWAETAVDEAVAGCEEVHVVGLSAGATIAAWLAQSRREIRHAICLAPFLGPSMVAPLWTGAVARLLVRLPNRMVWWDPRAKAALPRPPHALPWFATRPVGEVMWLGLNLMRIARHRPPAAQRITFATSDCDLAIQPRLVENLAVRWRQHERNEIVMRTFPAEERVPHDCIDPGQPGEVTSLVYPRVLDWLEEGLSVKNRI